MAQRTLEQKIDNLARMTQQGFLDVQKRFEDVDEQFAEIRESFATKAEFKEIRHDLHETEERLLDAIQGNEVKKRDFDALADDVEDLDRRVGVLEKKR